MTFVLPSQAPSARVSVDRVRMIRRSMRCFLFSVIGAIPLLGMGTAWLALRLRRELAEETGDPLRLDGMNRLFLVIFVSFVPLLYWGSAGIVLAMGIFLAGRQGWFLFRQYQQANPLEWNPARHLVYWGTGLAHAGLVLSSILIMIAIAFALHWIGG